MSATATAMKGSPLPLSAPMALAAHQGRKTQTRRVMLPQPVGFGPIGGLEFPLKGNPGTYECLGGPPLLARCPYGRTGDRLWVREPIRREGNRVLYVADGALHPDAAWRWKVNGLAARYMPRALCRLRLEITEVRVERLQEISEADILAEAVTVDVAARVSGIPWSSLPTLHHGWRAVWDALNGPRGYGWDVNPWVWAVSFRKLEVAHG